MSTELKAELVGTATNLISKPDEISGMRVSMVGGHIKQTAPIIYPELVQWPTGNELEYGKYLFNDKSLVDGTTLRVFKRVSPGNYQALEQAIFVRSFGDNGEAIDILEIHNRIKHDDVFASELELTEDGKQALRSSGGGVYKGMNLNQPPQAKDGEFAFGRCIPTAVISDPSLIEDSYTMSDEAAEGFMAYGYKKYVTSLKNGQSLANVMGTPTEPQYIPRVGDSIGANGKVMGVIEWSEEDAALELSDGDLYDPVAYYNKIQHNDGDPSGKGDARVVDVKVIRNDQKNFETSPIPKFNIPDRVQVELDQHAFKTREYYENILNYHIELAKEYGGEANIPYTRKATRFIYEAIAMAAHVLMGKGRKSKYFSKHLQTLNYNKNYAFERIETYRIEVTVRYPIPLTKSGKISDLSGTKGIVSKIMPVEDMPVDENGNRVHCMRAADATLRRSTYLPIYIIFMSHTAREVVSDKIVEAYKEGGIDAAWPLMVELSRDYNPEWAEVLEDTHTTDEQREVLYEEIRDVRFRAWIPNDYEKSFYEISRLLKEKYKVRKSKLLITKPNGEKVWTEKEFYIGDVYTIRLNKTGREFSSISSCRFDPFGTIAKTNSDEIPLRPAPTKACKWISESEERLLAEHGAGELAAECHDRANNPLVARQQDYTVLTHPTPMNIECAVDREEHPLGHSRPHQILQHTHHIAGLELQKLHLDEQDKSDPRNRS